MHFTPATEIGWRLAYDHWNKGYASEAALACLKLAFETLDLQEIVAFTAEKNMRSQAVMKKIGMHWSSEDNFDNPSFPEGHPSRKNVLYRIKKQQWQKEKGSL